MTVLFAKISLDIKKQREKKLVSSKWKNGKKSWYFSGFTVGRVYTIQGPTVGGPLTLSENISHINDISKQGNTINTTLNEIDMKFIRCLSR